MEIIDVLIVGAGPSGLTFAIECLRYGLSVQIIEKSQFPTKYSKAIAIQARTLETFQRMGIVEKFLKEGIKLNGFNLYSNKKKLAHINLDQIPSPFSFVLSLEQSKTESILIEHLKSLGCQVMHSLSLEDFEQKDGIIFAKTNKEEIRCKYLIGCDGSHSLIRKKLGCSFEGKLFPNILSLADVEMQWDLAPLQLHVFLESKGILAALPLPSKDRYRLIFQLERLKNFSPKNLSVEEGVLQTEETILPKIEEIQSLVSSYTGQDVRVSDPRWIANFHINSRLSNKYCKNNIFLVGDAAHIHSPVGGQGMNTGIQDAFNLAWKIAYTHKKNSKSKALINSYEEERLALGKKLLKATEKASSFVILSSPSFLFIRRFMITFLFSFKYIQKKIVVAISQVNIRYKHKRMENITLNYKGKEKKFFSLTEGSTNFHLILFGIEKSPINHPNVKVYKAKQKNSGKVILVRPDGYIAIEDKPPYKKLHDYKNKVLS